MKMEKQKKTKRSKEIKIRLSEDEFDLLNSAVCRTSAPSREDYLRCIINGYRPIAIPPADYAAMANELRALNKAVDQLFHAVTRSEASSTDVISCCMDLKSSTAILYKKVLEATLPQPISTEESFACLR